MINKRIKSAALFPNGNIITFGTDGQQIPELQGAYSIKLHQRILLEAIDDTQIRGFDILPRGFVKHAEDFVDYWKTQNKTWEEIEELCGESENTKSTEITESINTHQLKCIQLVFEKELENASEGIKQAKWDANQLNEFYNNGKHEALEMAIGKLNLFFETNKI